MKHWLGFAAGAALWAASLLLPSTAAADPRADVKQAWIDAVQLFGEIQLDEALDILDSAVARAQGAGLGDDPILAQVHVMRAGIIWAVSNNDRNKTMAAFREAVKLDYNVTLPIELRSQELEGMLDSARGELSAPTEGVIHTPPPATPDEDIEFAALSGQPLPDGGSLVLYWRPVGADKEFNSAYMTPFGNYGSATVAASEHDGRDLEYFIYVFDASNPPRAVANKGDKTNPLILEMGGGGAAGAGNGDGDGDGKGDDDKGKDDKGKDDKGKKNPPGKTTLPRFFINLGVGTGLGVARGTAEQTYEQYTPGTAVSAYGRREQACAVERWFAAGADLAGDPATFQANLATVQGAGASILPAPAEELVAAYDPDFCRRRHPVSTGLALAPFHVAPEFGVRVSNKVVVSLFTRLQVVTGSQVFTDDPTKQLSQSFNLDVRSPSPGGFKSNPSFTFAIGAKAKYFLGQDTRKFRLFIGGFFGYGFARLRVPMNFSNDRNGNSVPDAVETALHGQQDANGQIIPATCVAVWPYNAGCDNSEAGETDRQLAMAVRGATPSTDNRVDTVVIGPGFVGALFGFHYQIVKNFAIFAELDVGAWFPATTSGLFDLTVGPAITF